MLLKKTYPDEATNLTALIQRKVFLQTIALISEDKGSGLKLWNEYQSELKIFLNSMIDLVMGSKELLLDLVKNREVFSRSVEISFNLQFDILAVELLHGEAHSKIYFDNLQQDYREDLKTDLQFSKFIELVHLLREEKYKKLLIKSIESSIGFMMYSDHSANLKLLSTLSARYEEVNEVQLKKDFEKRKKNFIEAAKKLKLGL